MPVLWNFAKGKAERIGGGQVTEALRSGQYGLRKGGAYAVLDDQGELHSLDADEAAAKIHGGWSYADERREDLARTRKAAQDQSAQAAAWGFADTASMGLLSSMASDRDPQGRRAKDYLAALADENPIAFTVGSGGALLTGSGAAGLAGALARRGGQAAATGLGLGAGRTLAQRALARGVELGTAGAIEGALFGGAQAVSEDSLGRVDHTAESVLANMGIGAMFGAGAGTLIGAGGEVGGTLLRRAWRSRQAAEDVAEAAAGATGPEVAADAVEGLADVGAEEAAEAAKDPGLVARIFGRVTAEATGADAGAVAKMQLAPLSKRGMAIRKAVIETEKTRDEATRALTWTLDDSEEASRAIERLMKGTFKRSAVSKVVRRGNEQVTNAEARLVLSQVDDHLAKMQTEAKLYGAWGGAKVRQARKMVAGAKRDVARVMEGNAVDRNADVFIALDKLKRKLGSHAKPGGQVSEQAFETVKTMRTVYDDMLKAHLERVDLWGGAGELQARVNAKWSAYLSGLKQQRVQANLMTPGPQEGWDPTYVTDPAKVRRFVDNLASMKGEMPTEVMLRQMRARRDLVDEIGESLALSGGDAKIVAKNRAAVDKFEATLGEIEEKVALANEYQSLVKGEEAGRLFKLPGKLAATAIRQTYNVELGIHRLKNLAKVKAKTDRSVAESVKSFVAGAGKAAKKARKRPAGLTQRPQLIPASTGILLEHGILPRPKGEDEKDSKKALAARVAEIDELVSDPRALAERIATALAGIEPSAPKIATHLATTTAKALQFLRSKAPRNPAPDLLQPLTDRWEPSSSEVAKFKRYLAAVLDPLSVLDDLEARRLTPEGVEALREVYPALFADIGDKLAIAVAEHPERIPYKDRVQLSLLFHVQLDRTMTPGYLARNKAMYQPGSGPRGGQGGGGIRLTGLEGLELSDNVMTRAQQLEAGR